jgi:Tfp pilus assembly protein PilN
MATQVQVEGMNSMADKDVAALRKRAQIAKANRLMFIWVAIASVIASASVVLTVVIVQRGLHNQRAITELNKTVSTLRSNNENVPKLEDSLRALSSNESLLKLRTTESDNALQVILDALPADPNPSALGASLQTKLFPADLTVESMQVTPINATGVWCSVC